MKKFIKGLSAGLMLLSFLSANVWGLEMDYFILLNKVDFSKGKTLMQSLKDRQSSRNFVDKELGIDTLSELIFAAGGVTREDGKRTFPTAMNSLEVDIYVFMEKGVFIYQPAENRLKMISYTDQRADTGMQEFVAKASVNLVYVSDLSKMKGGDEKQKELMAAIDAGHISQNVYLYCASAGLGCVVRGSVDSGKILKILNLDSKNNRVFLAQSVGYIK